MIVAGYRLFLEPGEVKWRLYTITKQRAVIEPVN